MDSQKVCKLVKNHTISFRRRRQKAPAGQKTTAGAEGMRSLFSKQRGGQVTVAGIGQQNNNGLALVFGTLCQLDASPHSSAGRNANQYALRMTNLFAGGKSVVVLNGDDFVIDLGVQNIGHKASANALDLVGTRLALAQNRAGSRLNSNNLYVGVLLFQVGANAGHGAAGANACHKDIDLAVGIFPDLRSGCLLVCCRVCRVLKLLRNEAVCDLFVKFLCLCDGSLHRKEQALRHMP